MERRSLLDYLDNFAFLGEQCAYVERAGYRRLRWTYGAVAEFAFRFARELEARGVGKGDRVLIWGPNTAEWVGVFFGCVLRGAIVIPMDDAANAGFVSRVSQQVNSRLLVNSRVHPNLPGLVLEE